MHGRIFAVALAFGSVSCSHVPPTGTAPVAATEAAPTKEYFGALMANSYVTPFKAGDVETWLKIFDEDIVALHNFLPAMQGKDQVRQFGSFVRDNLNVAEMSVTIEGVRTEGNIAYTWGRFHSRLLMKDSGKPMPGHSENGKIFFLWKKQTDGSWKLAVDMGNALRTPDQP
jgi:ketosteroid isomerase-like protein